MCSPDHTTDAKVPVTTLKRLCDRLSHPIPNLSYFYHASIPTTVTLRKTGVERVKIETGSIRTIIGTLIANTNDQIKN